MENKYIGILKKGYNLEHEIPLKRFTWGNEGMIFELKEDGFYYCEGNKFTKEDISHDLEKGYLKVYNDGK